MAVSFCYVTAGSRDEALTIGRTIVQERLAACANVLDGMTSIYWWQGALEQAGEAVLILKTRAELVERLTMRIQRAAPLRVPLRGCPADRCGQPGIPRLDRRGNRACVTRLSSGRLRLTILTVE
jgi:periplasmic divalent cation tolerance protein